MAGKTFMDYVNNPKYIVDSKAFNITSYFAKIVIMMVLAFVGITISGFQYNTFEDILSIAYWLTVGVTLIEQLWANDASYQFFLYFFKEANNDVKIADEKASMIIYGAYSEDGAELKDEKGQPLITPITKTSEVKYADKAVTIINEEDKLEHVTKQINSLIGFFQNKLEYFKLSKKKRYLFPRIIKIKKFVGIPFWSKKASMKFCEQKISEGQSLIKNKDRILAIPDKQIKGYRKLDINDLITEQEDKFNPDESQFFMRDRKKARAKSVLGKAVWKAIASLLGLGLLFGSLESVDTKTIITVIILIVYQLYAGAREAMKHVKHYVLVNAQRRSKALQKIYSMIPDLKAQEKKQLEEEKAKLEAFRAELAKEQVKLLTTTKTNVNDTYTTDIIPNNILPKFRKHILGIP